MPRSAMPSPLEAGELAGREANRVIHLNETPLDNASFLLREVPILGVDSFADAW